MKNEYYIININKLKEIFNNNIEAIEERMAVTEINEVEELIDGKLVVIKRESKQQMISNETKLKVNQILTHCLELILVDKEVDEEPLPISNDDEQSEAYLLAVRTLIFYGILEKKD